MNKYNAYKQKSPKIPRYDNNAPGQNNRNRGLGGGYGDDPAPGPSTAMQTDDIWGDEEEDDFLFYATQMAEKQEGIANVPNPVRNREVNEVSPQANASMENSEITPAENLLLRRQRLEDNSRFLPDNFSTVLRCDRKLEETVKALEKEVDGLKNENYRLKGEASMVRKQMAETKAESSATITQMVMMKAQMKDQKTTVDKDYKKEIEKLHSQINDYKLQLAKLKISPQRPLTRKTSQGNTSIPSMNPEAFLEPMSQPSPSKPPSRTMGHFLKEKAKLKPLVVTREMQTDNVVMAPPPVENVESGIKQEVRVGLENEDLVGRLTPEEIREDILRTIDKMVQLRYQMVLPILESVVRKAPKEIMKRLVRGCDIKSAFPDVIDSMFQWGIDTERKKLRACTGVTEPTPPVLPFQYEPGIHFHEIKIGIEIRFQYAGTWGALMEVREWLQQVLKSLEGEGRFRLYERNTLMNFWRLLFWANELWRCIVFEEENEELIETNKDLWAKELEGWTGLVLKCDWRDYFVLEMEVLVRHLTLSILQSIVTAGYFEPKQNRYVILYRIIKDVLSKDVFRDATNVQHILKIVTWSISDVMIMKHLCYKSNESGDCLARVIGENVLKVCRQESDPMTVAILCTDYMHLLETLLLENPVSYHHSHIARLSRNSTEDISSESSLEEEPPEEDSMMDCDFPSTQFACPIKYTIEPAEVQNNIAIEDLQEDLNCWLEPKRYEDPFGRLSLCQCRKFLVGSAIFILHKVLELWRKNYIEYEKEIERLERDEEEEMEILQSGTLVPDTSNSAADIDANGVLQRQRQRFIKGKRTFLTEFLPKAEKALRNRCVDLQWNWDDVIRKGREIIPDPLPQWVLDYERRGNIFDLAIAKGILFISFLQDRSENIAAAMGTEAYKIYMILLPLLRLHRDRIDLNGVDRNVLIAITPECEEDQLASSNLSSQQVNSKVNYDTLQDLPEVTFPLEALTNCTSDDYESLGSFGEEISNLNDPVGLEASFQTLHFSKDEIITHQSRIQGN